MFAGTTTFDTSDAAISPRERAGRALMWLAALGAAGSAGMALLTVLDAGGATKIVETWRLYGLVVFAGLFVLLALHPHRYRGVWELAIVSKLALTVTAAGYAVHGGINGAGAVIGWDGVLTAVLITAYICCRGWTAIPRLPGTIGSARHNPGHPVGGSGGRSPAPSVTASRDGSA